MSFAAYTPEALLPRSDSKNPATTCKGITTTGRPCRRSLGSSAASSPGPSPLKDRGVLAILREEQDDGNTAAAFYCWQHKDQAEKMANSGQNHTDLFPLKERTSIDTLVDRVGVMNLEADPAPAATREKRKKTRNGASTAKTKLPSDWQHVQGPLMSVPSNLLSPAAQPKQRHRTERHRSNVKASILCCVRDVGDDEKSPSSHHSQGASNLPPNRVVEIAQNAVPAVQSARLSIQTPSPMSQRPNPSTPNRASALPRGLRTPTTPTRPSMLTTPQSTGSQTQALLSLLPPNLSPRTTSILLTELSKPISPADTEGYIYMFWLTPESDAFKPDDDAASNLLEAPTTSQPQTRRKSDVLQRYVSQRNGPTQAKTVLLKIGRAENVHRRLSQWTKQCSYNITLIRYYPYTPSRSPPQSDRSIQPRKVPHVHRVERLIHVELAEKRFTQQAACEDCGREHREWFEVEASREGLRAVDEVIRRWIGWAEGLD